MSNAEGSSNSKHLKASASQNLPGLAFGNSVFVNLLSFVIRHLDFGVYPRWTDPSGPLCWGRNVTHVFSGRRGVFGELPARRFLALVVRGPGRAAGIRERADRGSSLARLVHAGGRPPARAGGPGTNGGGRGREIRGGRAGRSGGRTARTVGVVSSGRGGACAGRQTDRRHSVPA